ncbi:MAG: transposase, partial [Actinobacteria bacterium]|nr:transposase [Actinomycetota bacterium]
EAYQGFSAWLRFGHEAIERNDPAEQEKIIKFNTLLANCVIFHTALDMTTVLRELAAEGWHLSTAALGSLSPYITEPIKRFGEYATDGLTIPPAAFDPRLNLPQRGDDAPATADMAA